MRVPSSGWWQKQTVVDEGKRTRKQGTRDGRMPAYCPNKVSQMRSRAIDNNGKQLLTLQHVLDNAPVHSFWSGLGVG